MDAGNVMDQARQFRMFWREGTLLVDDGTGPQPAVSVLMVVALPGQGHGNFQHSFVTMGPSMAALESLAIFLASNPPVEAIVGGAMQIARSGRFDGALQMLSLPDFMKRLGAQQPVVPGAEPRPGPGSTKCGFCKGFDNIHEVTCEGADWPNGGGDPRPKTEPQPPTGK